MALFSAADCRCAASVPTPTRARARVRRSRSPARRSNWAIANGERRVGTEPYYSLLATHHSLVRCSCWHYGGVEIVRKVFGMGKEATRVRRRERKNIASAVAHVNSAFKNT